MASESSSQRSPKLFEFLRHVHPVAVDPTSLKAAKTLGLGVVALTLSGILLLSGVLLMVFYIPAAESAYGSIQNIQSVVPFGALMRNIHRWAGHALVAVVGLHLLRTLLTGSYKGRKRRGVWTAGVWLLLVTLGFAFTGYLLPWDQLSYWAVNIGGHLAANVPGVGNGLRRALLGGDVVGGATLIRFYALHVGILPLLATTLIALHLFRLRRAGGLARPSEAPRVDRLPSWPLLFERELALAVATLAVVILAGLILDAPLGPEPDLAHPEDPSKAPWYFLFLQELVSYSVLVGGVMIPALAVVTLYALPWFDGTTDDAGRWFAPKPAATLFTGGFAVGLVTVVASLAWLPNPALALLVVVGVGAVGTWVLAHRRTPMQAARLTSLAVVGFCLAALTMLSAIGWLRGPSWSLTLPWVTG